MVARWLYERPQFLGHTYFSGKENDRLEFTKNKKTKKKNDGNLYVNMDT